MKEYFKKEFLIKDDRFEMKYGGARRSEAQNLYNALKFLDYLKTLKPGKMYGIIKCDDNITFFTKNEVIFKNKIKNNKGKRKDV